MTHDIVYCTRARQSDRFSVQVHTADPRQNLSFKTTTFFITYVGNSFYIENSISNYVYKEKERNLW